MAVGETLTAGPSTPEPGFLVRVFGSTGFDEDGIPVSIGGKRQQRLLALLAIRAGSVVDLDWLAEHLWDDHERPDPAQPPIRTYMSRLRSALPEEAREWIETETGGYRFAAPPDAVDYLKFGTLRAGAAQARANGDPLTARRLLDRAVTLWRGDPFRELEDRDWALPQIERLRLDRLEVLEERWEAELALGRHTQITGELAAFTAEHGLRDRAVRQFALALHRSGRTAEALQSISAHRRDLAEQSGLDPSPEMSKLESALLAGDPSLAAESLGRPLRGYRLLEEVGSGAFSIVWRGTQPSVNRDVAIKQIRAELATQAEFIRRFEAEAHLVARIEHPHIVPLIDFWRDPDSAYLVMRWLGGGTLERRLDDGVLTVEEVVALAGQVGGALSTAHAHGVVHRDVKTANIMFDEQGNAFLADFGIALSTEASGGPEAALSQGTPTYASPEQTRREPLAPTADIYSLGVVLYECLTGTLPTSPATPPGEIQIGEDPRPPSVHELRTDVPRHVSDAIDRATAFDPNERFKTVSDFIGALGPSASTSAGETTFAPHADSSKEPENPYVGLHAFDGGDSDRFFGRERLVRELVDRLSADTVASRCVVLVGPSGSGKSSVVRAGLVPAIRAGEVPGSDAWFTTTMVPGVNAYEALEAALLRVAVNPPTSLLDQLQDGKRGILRTLRRCLSSDDDRVLLVIDQFEELFVGPFSADADAFLDALATAIEDPLTPIRLAITIRADYYDRPLLHPAFAPIVKASAVEVTPLAGDELEQAIIGPAQLVGVEFEGGVVALLAAETIHQSAPLPLLQYTLRELFEHRNGRVLTLAAYDEIGGIGGALAARAEALFTDATAERKAAIRKVFGRLTNPGEASTDLRRRAPVADLGDDPAAKWVLESYGEARLLTFDRDVGSREPTVEVSHEALLREWPRLVGWLAEDIDLLRSVDTIAIAADTWSRGGGAEADLYRGPRLDSATAISLSSPGRLRPVDTEFIQASQSAAEKQRKTEEARIQGLRRLVAGIAVALVVALIAGGLAIRQSSRADDEAERARDAAALADEQRLVAITAARQAELAALISRSAAQQDEDPELSLLLALEAHRRSPTAETEQAVLSALGSTSLGNRLASNRTLIDPDGPCSFVNTSRDGTNEFAVVDERLVRRELLTGAVTDHGPTPATCVRWLGDEQADRRVAVSEDGLSLWLGPFEGPWDIEQQFEEANFLISKHIPASGNLLFRAGRLNVDASSAPAVTLIDATTGAQVGPIISHGDIFSDAAESQDGAFVAVWFGDVPGSQNVIYVIDGNTAQELLRLTTPLPVALAVVDDRTEELVVALAGSSNILTFDLTTGELVAEVERTASSDLVGGGLDIDPDGLVITVSGNQIERLDRRLGPTGTTSPVENITFARVRPDGTVLTGTIDEQTSIFDLDSNALVEQAWEVKPFSIVDIEAGVATVVGFQTNEVETIDLASGERTAHTIDVPEVEGSIVKSAFSAADEVFILQSAGGLWHGQGEDRRNVAPEVQSSGNRDGDLWTGGEFDGFGYQYAVLVDLAADPPRQTLRVPAPSLAALHPTPDGGIYVLDSRGLLRVYDKSGTRIQVIEIEGADLTEFQLPVNQIPPGAIDVNSANGTLAVLGLRGEVLLVDPESGDVQTLPGVNAVSSFGFVRNGELLAVIESDGSVVLWNLDRLEPAGLVWRGTGVASQGSVIWSDEATETMWVSVAGQIVAIPTNPERWVKRACRVVGRDFTQAEWDRLVPGDNPLISACP
ncbi:MAG: protein kinase domain-containing protein [Acidimicrobiales bacterium]